MVQKTLRLFYVIKLLASFGASFAFSTYVLFLLDHGLNFLEVNLVNLTFMASIFLLEIPTGAFADSLGRKNSVVFGYLFWAICHLVYFMSGSLWMFLIAEILGAIGACLISGAFEAWAVDTLKFQGYTGGFEEIFAKGGIFASIGTMVGAVIGGYLGSVNLAIPWLAGFIVLFSLFVFSKLYMKEEYFKPKPFKLKSTFAEMKKIASASVKYSIKHPIVVNIVAAGLLLGIATQPWNMFWSPYFNEDLNIDVSLLGWVFAAISIFSMAGMYFAKHTLVRLKERRKVLIFNVLLISIAIAISALADMPSLVVFFFLVHEIGRGMWKPIQTALMNDYIPSEQRATVISFDSMVSHGGSAVGLFASGIVATAYGVPVSWIAAAALLLLAIPFFMKIKEKK